MGWWACSTQCTQEGSPRLSFWVPMALYVWIIWNGSLFHSSQRKNNLKMHWWQLWAAILYLDQFRYKMYSVVGSNCHACNLLSLVLFWLNRDKTWRPKHGSGIIKDHYSYTNFTLKFMGYFSSLQRLHQ